MRRYWVPEDSFEGDQVLLKGDVHHHIFEVCRQGLGSKFEVLNGQGQALFVEVIEENKKTARAKILSTRPLPVAPSPRIILALSVPRFPVFEALLEKCVELGVAEIQLFFSENSFVRSQNKISEGRWERWNKIIISGTQQSGRGDRLQLSPPCSIGELKGKINRKSPHWGLIAFEGETPVSLGAELGQGLPQGIQECWLVVGPEGGFTGSEVDWFSSWGIKPVTLGDKVLRVETACITLVSALKYQAGHFGQTK